MKNILLIICISALNGCSTASYISNGIDINNKESYSYIRSGTVGGSYVLAGLNQSILIESIDEKSLWSLKYRLEFPESAYILPGEHKIVFKFSHFNSYARACFFLKTEKGSEYVVRQNAGQYSVKLWIEDLTNNQVVGKNCDS